MAYTDALTAAQTELRAAIAAYGDSLENLTNLSQAQQTLDLYANVEYGLAAAGTVVLGTFKANSNGTGYSTSDIIILKQTPPSAPVWYNATTDATITPNPAHLDAVVGTLGASVAVTATVDAPEKTIKTATGTFNASGDNTAIDISAVSGYVAGNYIVITAIRVQNEVGTANTVLLKDGATTKGRYYLAASAGAGFDRVYANNRELRLTADTDLILNLSAATAIGYSIEYFLES